MSKRGIKGCLAGLLLWAGSLAWADDPVPAPAPSNDPAIVMTPAPTITPASGVQAAKASGAGAGNAAVPSKAVLTDAFIAQNMLRVYLDRPSAVTVYNSRGQQVAHLDSRRAMETFPLQGISTGFIYLTVRTAQGELTRKLVYTGK